MIELHSHSSFSFLRGTSDPLEMIRVAADRGYEALAICDYGGFYGSARAHVAAKQVGLKALVGTMLEVEGCGLVPVLVRNRSGYRALCRMHTNKHLDEEIPVAVGFGDLVCLTGGRSGSLHQLLSSGKWQRAKQLVECLIARFGQQNVYIEAYDHCQRGDKRLRACWTELANRLNLKVIVSNTVIYAQKKDKLLADAFKCLKNYTNLDRIGKLLDLNSQCYFQPVPRLLEKFSEVPQWVQNSIELGRSLDFTLENLGYTFPKFRHAEKLMSDEEECAYLKKLVFSGAEKRYGKIKNNIRDQVNHELELISKLGFSGYFLIIWDIAQWAKSQGILCQGRGSAANSVVCYALEITNADPIGCDLLFERFLSESRRSWPDVDIDFPSGERREAVIQYVYEKYAPRGAAMTANVITYRKRSAFREMAKVLGFDDALADRFSKTTVHQEKMDKETFYKALKRCGVEANHPRKESLAHLFYSVLGKPRHLGQHPGGMIISDQGLDHIVPLQRASMVGRRVLQWDKNDCESLGLVKVDLLGLGMLAAIEDTLRLCRERGRPVTIAEIPKDDEATYDLMCSADTVGTFQVESRAQMATLPIMRPRCFYDVVVEVALIRPGPIVGELVHPYLNRRKGREAVDYIDPLFEPILKRTLGVPLFQEQVLKMAMVIADFTGTEAEDLRKAMSFERSHTKMESVTTKLRNAMSQRGVDKKVQNKVIDAIGSFALYGFPESHAISFALIAYASCWLKQHRTVEFYCGLLNNQPMGFYSSSSLIYDARRRGVRVKPVCVQKSNIETSVVDHKTIRLGLQQLEGVSQGCVMRLVEERSKKKFVSMRECLNRVRPNKKERRVMALSGAFNGLPEVDHRREAMWQAELILDRDDLFYESEGSGHCLRKAPLNRMDEWERLNADFTSIGVTTGGHPMYLWRRLFDPEVKYYRASDLFNLEHGQAIYLSGMVICRQRPTTGKGHCFLSMEDETGMSNLFIPRPTFEKYRLIISTERFLLAYGRLQVNEGGSRSLYVMSVEPLPNSPDGVRVRSHDYC